MRGCCWPDDAAAGPAEEPAGGCVTRADELGGRIPLIDSRCTGGTARSRPEEIVREPMAPILSWLRRHDPELNALHKAIKVAIVVTVGLAIGTLVIGNPNLSLFASFGGVAFLLFADFPGNKVARFGAYLILAVVGAVLITLGTLASAVAWTAVLGMRSSGSWCSSPACSAPRRPRATRAALLTFILPVTVPGTAADIPARLAGWGIAAALAIPVGVLLWPPRDHDALRARAADACRALGRQCRPGRDAGDDGPGQPIASEPTPPRRRRRVRAGDRRTATAVPRHHLPTGGADHRQPAAGSADRPAGVAQGGGRQASRPAPPTSGPHTARDLVQACAAVLDAPAHGVWTRTASDRPSSIASSWRPRCGTWNEPGAQVVDALMLVRDSAHRSPTDPATDGRRPARPVADAGADGVMLDGDATEAAAAATRGRPRAATTPPGSPGRPSRCRRRRTPGRSSTGCWVGRSPAPVDRPVRRRHCGSWPVTSPGDRSGSRTACAARSASPSRCCWPRSPRSPTASGSCWRPCRCCAPPR